MLLIEEAVELSHAPDLLRPLQQEKKKRGGKKRALETLRTCNYEAWSHAARRPEVEQLQEAAQRWHKV
jgi:hypothetical protein